MKENRTPRHISVKFHNTEKESHNTEKEKEPLKTPRELKNFIWAKDKQSAGFLNSNKRMK